MTKLETTTHIALLSLAAIAGYLMLEQRFAPQAPKQLTRGDLEQSLQSTSLTIPKAGWGDHERTLALQISATCPFCVANEPFYKTLVKTRDGSSRTKEKIGIVVLTADDEEELRMHLKSAGIVVDKIIQVNPETTGTAATPVVFYVDPKGQVQRAFVGRLDDTQQTQVLQLLNL